MRYVSYQFRQFGRVQLLLKLTVHTKRLNASRTFQSMVKVPIAESASSILRSVCINAELFVNGLVRDSL